MRPCGLRELVHNHEEAYLLFPNLFQFTLESIDTFTINIRLVQLVPAIEKKFFRTFISILCLTTFHE